MCSSEPAAEQSPAPSNVLAYPTPALDLSDQYYRCSVPRGTTVEFILKLADNVGITLSRQGRSCTIALQSPHSTVTGHFSLVDSSRHGWERKIGDYKFELAVAGKEGSVIVSLYSTRREGFIKIKIPTASSRPNNSVEVYGDHPFTFDDLKTIVQGLI